ncbi:TPA: hypothetical protein RQK05_003416 [Vibrio vulnificus]|nr:hypothetical protein [Vibrio vulnificus]HDY7748725.1 hypothetical protein [Vibrio vulnificus]HDY7757610.1 hypothetical protein [Vibrio vulnificus]HDY7762707.1 hypothetical protein [Vibrio vulnificus]HDY7771830.1 hypothetical protein [Vibrio vulnificus]
MAYLPFYITPEELAAYQEVQEHEILTGENLTTWHKYDVEEPFRYHFKLTALPFMSFLFVIVFLTHSSDTLVVTFFGLILSVMMAGVFYLTIGLDYRYDYIFSDKGFVMKKRRNMPKWVNTATQAIGWIGAVVCVVMVAVAGPMALVGAGALILLSFGILKRQPDERTEVRIGEREDWLFAYYNKKRKVIRFYHKYDDCSKWDLVKHTVFRTQTRGYSYLFFKTVEELDEVLEILSNRYDIECIEFPNHKEFFEGRPEPRLKDIPSRSLEFPVEDTFDLRAQNAPLPAWRRIYNGKWQTESEIEQLKASEREVAKE